MLNLIGASCIFIAGSMLGGFKAAGYRKRPQQIRQLITSLHYLCTEIDYGLSPLLSALRQTALTTSSPVSAIYMNTVEQMTTDRLALSQAWKLAVELSRPKLDLFPAELEVLAQLGQSLGISNREDQLKHLTLCIQQLQTMEREAQKNQKQFEKVWQGLGVMSALFIILVLL
jgi:stage III sporulation protein AB